MKPSVFICIRLQSTGKLLQAKDHLLRRVLENRILVLLQGKKLKKLQFQGSFVSPKIHFTEFFTID